MTLRKKKYLFLMRTAQISGAEQRLMDYFAQIDYDRYKVTWAVRKDAFSAYMNEKSLPVRIILLPPSWDKQSFIQRFLNFYRFLRKERPDAVIFHQFYLISFSLPELIAGFLITKGNSYMFVHDSCHLRNKPVDEKGDTLMSAPGLWQYKDRLFKMLLVYFTKSTITVSDRVSNLLIRVYGYPATKIKVALHGIDIQKFSPSKEERIEVRRRLNLSDSDTVIVSTSRLERIKRLDRLIEAFKILAERNKNIYLYLLGEGEKYSELLGQINHFGEDIKKRIKFLGFVNEVNHFLPAFDIYVLSSDSEGFSRSCMEAMSCGLISVVTDSGGQSDLIKDGANGFLVEKSLAGVLRGLERALALDKSNMDIISGNARREIIEKCRLQDKIRHTLSLFNMVTGDDNSLHN